jgi:hypothetical protein
MNSYDEWDLLMIHWLMLMFGIGACIAITRWAWIRYWREPWHGTVRRMLRWWRVQRVPWPDEIPPSKGFRQ